MSEYILEDVLNFSADYVNALCAETNVLKHITACDICNSIMLDPYTLQCGHSFCGKCLESWTHERVSNSTCPTCRAAINTAPVMSLGLRQLALAITKSWNRSHEEKVSEEVMAQREPPEFFPEGALVSPVYDIEDDIYRCPHCSHEIEDDGRCSGCQAYFAAHDMFEDDPDDQWGTDTDYDEDTSEGDETSTSRARRRRASGLREVTQRITHRMPYHDESDDDDDDDEDQENADYDEEDLGSFIDDASVSEPETEEEHDADDAEEEHADGSYRDKNDDAMVTSGDSFFDDTRSRHDESDIEVTDVRHRPIIIDDDDDDEDD